MLKYVTDSNNIGDNMKIRKELFLYSTKDIDIEEFLKYLNPAEKETFILYIGYKKEQLNEAEISRKLNISRQTINYRIKNIKNKLIQFKNNTKQKTTFIFDQPTITLNAIINNTINNNIDNKSMNIINEIINEFDETNINKKTKLLINTIKNNNSTHIEKKDYLINNELKQIYYYYYNLKRDAKKIIINIRNNNIIKKNQKKVLYSFIQVEKILLENELKTINKKANTLIDLLNRTHKLPPISNDKTDIRTFYNELYYRYRIIMKKIDNHQPIFLREKIIIYYYIKIQNELSKQQETIKNTSKIKEKINYIIDIIYKDKKIPSSKNRDIKFTNGNNVGSYYHTLRKKYKDIMIKKNNNQQITEEEQKLLDNITILENIYSFYKLDKKENIENIKKLLKHLNIDIEKNKEILKKAYYEIYIKILFLIENNIEITDELGHINKIIFESDLNMQKDFNISIDELAKKYINGKNSINDSYQYIKK